MPTVKENEQFLRSLHTPGHSAGPAFHATPYDKPPGPYSLLEGDFTTAARPMADWVDYLARLYEHGVAYQAAIQDDTVPLASLWTGTQVYAAAFGAPAHFYPNMPPAARPIFFSGEEADRAIEPDAENCPLVQKTLELAELLRKRLGQNVFFSPIDVQTGFDTAALLWDKTSFYTALADPEEQPAVERLVHKCGNFLKAVLAALRREIPTMSPQHCPGAWSPPEMGPWVSNDECGAMSAEMFERFCLPELIDLANRFGGLGMHCCADQERHYPAFAKIPGFYGFNGKKELTYHSGPAVRYFGHANGPIIAVGALRDQEVEDMLNAAPEGARFQITLDALPIDQARERHDRLMQRYR